MLPFLHLSYFSNRPPSNFWRSVSNFLGRLRGSFRRLFREYLPRCFPGILLGYFRRYFREWKSFTYFSGHKRIENLFTSRIIGWVCLLMVITSEWNLGNLAIHGELILSKIFIFNRKDDYYQESANFQQIIKQKNLEKELTLVLIAASKKLRERWQYGDIEENFSINVKEGTGSEPDADNEKKLSNEKKYNCPQEIVPSDKISDLYLRCNPNYLQCFFSGQAGVKDPSIKIKKGNQTYTVMPKAIFPPVIRYSSRPRFYTILSSFNLSGPVYGVRMELFIKEYPQYSLPVILEDTCSTLYLPQRSYVYLNWINDNLQEERWDNFYRHIYVDKFLVSYRDVIEWIEYGGGDKSITIPSDRKKWAAPATNLNSSQMQRYCAFRGKEVLTAQVYDAATVILNHDNNENVINENGHVSSELPMDLYKTYPINYSMVRSLLPWAEDEKDSFIYQAQRKIAVHLYAMREKGITASGLNRLSFISDTYVTKDNCDLLYFSECREYYPYEFYNSNTTSWMGITQLLGGYLEYLPNPIHPLKNLKASSFYLGLVSKWHRLGRRGYWDGQGFSKDNLRRNDNDNGNSLVEDFELNNNETLQIGFRCMLIIKEETKNLGEGYKN